MLHTDSKTPSHAAEQLQIPWQYCGHEDHQSSTCPQVDVCPTCQTKNHSLLYICLLLRSTKGQEKDFRVYNLTIPLQGIQKQIME